VEQSIENIFLEKLILAVPSPWRNENHARYIELSPLFRFTGAGYLDVNINLGTREKKEPENTKMRLLMRFLSR
jgi:hypothetical protein